MLAATPGHCWSSRPARLRINFFSLVRIIELPGLTQHSPSDPDPTTMAGLWEIEADIRGQDPEMRVKARQEKSAAIVAALFDLWDKELPRLSGKSKCAEAIRDATSRSTAVKRFLSDGRIEIDSNTVERAIRPQTITRKNALFAGSHGGGRTWATFATLLQTEDERCRSARLTRTNSRTDRAGLADLSDRCSHALALQSLNGLSSALTPHTGVGGLQRRSGAAPRLVIGEATVHQYRVVGMRTTSV